jgi:hypothetical protein
MTLIRGTRHWSSATALLLLLIASDLGFVAVHMISELTPLVRAAPLLNIEVDHSYPEIFQYLKFFWIVLLLGLIALQKQQGQYGAWALLFFYLLLDDALGLHEFAGVSLAGEHGFEAALGLRAVDFGELIGSAVAAVSLGSGLVWAYRRGSPEFKAVSHDLAVMVAGLVFFGVGVDMAHELFDQGPVSRFAFGLLEDGGEMLMASLIVWYVFNLQRHGCNTSLTTTQRFQAALLSRPH